MMLPPQVARVLERTPVERWGYLALLIDGEGGAQIMSRGELASWLRSNDLGDLADEAVARRVPPRGLLLLDLGRDGARFRVFGGERSRPGVPRGRTTPPRRITR